MKIFLLLITLSISAYCKNTSYIDFGVVGKTYEIEEENIYSSMQKGIDEYLKEHDIKKEIQDAAIKTLEYKSHLPVCQGNRFEKFSSIYSLPAPIINPLGRIVHKKGDRIRNKAPFPYDLLFIDPSLKNSKKIIQNFIKTSKKEKDATYSIMIANKNIQNISLDEAYPSSRDMENMYHVDCYPTIIHVEGDYIYKYEIAGENTQ